MANGIQKWLVVMAALLFAGGAMTFAADRATLVGKVTDAAGKPLDHATVFVYHAGVKKGYSSFCPSCYTDCGKRAATDASGAFKIDGLSRDLWFELLVVRAGYTPTFVKKVDPLQGPAPTAALSARTPVDEPARAVRGLVVDPQGDPLRNAVVTPVAIQVGDSSIYGEPEGLDPIATTDEKGYFELANRVATAKMALMVEARGMAPKFIILPTGAERHSITVSDGVLVRGRVVRDGKPVAGVEVGLSPKESFFGGMNLAVSGSPYSTIRIGTREDGSFVIPNVPAPESWNLYGMMESIAPLGASSIVAVATERDGQQLNVGDIQIAPGYRLRGKVTLSDDKPVADGTRLYVDSDQTRDSQSVLLATDGSYEFTGLTAGKCSLWSSVRGYHVTNGNPSVDHDMDHFDIVLDPDKAAPAQPTHVAPSSK